MSALCVINRIKSLILTILNLFKRVLCVFHKRRRKPSGDVIMEHVVIDSCNPKDSKRADKLVSWNTWDDSQPSTVEDHIEQYRKSLNKLRTASEEIAHEPDFFNDMTPNINTANALKLNFRSHPTNSFQKVTFDVQEDFVGSIITSPELGEIADEDEDVQTGWEADEDLSQVLKKQKMDERKKRSEDILKKKEARKTASVTNGL